MITGKRSHYTKEMIEFLRTHYPNHFADELTKMFNKKFRLDKTLNQIRGAIKCNKIKAGGHRTKRKWSQEQKDFVRDTYKELNIPRLTIAFNERFKCKATVMQIRAITRNNGYKSGRTGMYEKGHTTWNAGMKGLMTGGDAGWFKPGHMPSNHRPLGSERINVDGYIEIKVCEPAKWDLKQRHVWRQNFGDITSDDLIIFRDNNPLNCDIENLAKIDKRINGSLNKLGHCHLTGEVKDAAVLLAKVRLKTKDIA